MKPDFYTRDNQDDFIAGINMDNYFYQDVWDQQGDHGEWLPKLVLNHLCALKSQKCGLEMVENFVAEGNKFKHVIFVRPDVLFYDPLPIQEVDAVNDIFVPDQDHEEGLNDRFAILKYDKAHIYGKRIDEIAEFRKTQGRIVSEKYVKFIVNKYQLNLKEIKVNFLITRP